MIWLRSLMHRCVTDSFTRWAWQNAHLTRRIPSEQRITEAQSKVSTSPKTGRTRRRPARPRTSLLDKLSNLHLLLRVQSFRRWPLEVRFFCEDVFKVWNRWSERVDGSIRQGINFALDIKQAAAAEAIATNYGPLSSTAKGKRRRDAIGNGGLEGIDVGYSSLKSYVEKGLFLLADGEMVSCAVCGEDIGSTRAFVLVCSDESCRSASHIGCLATKFLAEGEEPESVIPVEGNCPSCTTRLKWAEMVKELSLRTRGGPEIERMMKQPRVRKSKTAKESKSILSASIVEDEDDNEAAEEDEVAGEEFYMQAQDFAESTSNGDDWVYEEGDDHGVRCLPGLASEDPHMALELSPSRSRQPQDARIEIVIEDSDWDDAIVLD